MRLFLAVVFFLTFFLSPVTADVIYPDDVSGERVAVETMWQAILRMPTEQRPHIVVVLGGGGARGLSHIGVLRVLEQERVPVDEIVGVSVGALIGSLYAAGLPLDQIQQMAHDVGWKNLTNFSAFRVIRLMFTRSLFSTQKMESYLEHYTDKKTFRELPIPFSCTATDLRTGERVVFDEGPVALAARASATIPGIFTPVEYRQRLLVDGGLVDNLPIDLAREKFKNSFVIGVLPKSGPQLGEVKSTFGSLIRAIEIQKEQISDNKKNTADFLIEPPVQQVSIADLSKNEFCINAGLVETRKNILDLKKRIIAQVLAQRGNQP